MSIEVELSKEIITSYLMKSPKAEVIAEALFIKRGNKELLLSHIDALVSIFSEAKRQLEQEIEGDRSE